MVLEVPLGCADARKTSLSLGTTVAAGIEHEHAVENHAQAPA
jgi:hypothetical protein